MGEKYPIEPTSENEEVLEQEKPRIVENALSPIQREFFRLNAL